MVHWHRDFGEAICIRELPLLLGVRLINCVVKCRENFQSQHDSKLRGVQCALHFLCIVTRAHTLFCSFTILHGCRMSKAKEASYVSSQPYRRARARNERYKVMVAMSTSSSDMDEDPLDTAKGEWG